MRRSACTRRASGRPRSPRPPGWRDRLIPYRNENTNGVTGWCLEIHDLWTAKIAAAREKDYSFCRALLRAGLVDPDVLHDRARTVGLDDVRQGLLEARVRGVTTSIRPGVPWSFRTVGRSLLFEGDG